MQADGRSGQPIAGENELPGGDWMTKYVIKRILLMFLTLFVIMTMCFVLIKLLPLPAVREMGRDINLIMAKREQMGYNKPIMVQYFLFWKSIVTAWDWGVGEQMYEGLSVWNVLINKLPYTVLVNLYSILIAIPLGLMLGIYAALKKNRWQDHLISTLVVVFISVPSYVYAFLVQYLFCFRLGWFPLTLESLDNASLFSARMFRSMFPAIMSLGFGVVAVFGFIYLNFMDYASARVTAWQNPWSDPQGAGFQIVQSLYAIGSGGLFGLGFGKSRQKYLYLPFQYNDYIFAVICEELGFVGALGIMALFAMLILRGYWIALRASTRFSTVLAAGLTTLIAVQTVLNLCVVTNLLPSTGIALPFFSYGGTALAVNLGEMGIVLSISRERNEIKRD